MTRAPGAPLRRAATALAVAAVASCTDVAAPVPAPAYDPTQFTDGRVYRWPTGTTVAVYVDLTGTGNAVDLAGAATSAMAAWKAALDGSQLAFRRTNSPADADVIIHLSDAPRLVALAGCAEPPSDASVTVFCPARDTALTLPLRAGASSGRVKVDISVNPAAVLAGASLEALTAHELGHAIGIGGHSSDARDVMYTQPQVRAPSQRDASTLRWVVRQAIGIRL